MKKLRKSPIVIALYVIGILGLIYSFYVVGTTLAYISSYYKSYGMSPGFGESFKYVLQSAFAPFMTSVLVLAVAYILNEVRALNPAYYATAEEIAEAKEANKTAKIKENAMKSDKETEATTTVEEDRVEVNFAEKVDDTPTEDVIDEVEIDESKIEISDPEENSEVVEEVIDVEEVVIEETPKKKKSTSKRKTTKKSE